VGENRKRVIDLTGAAYCSGTWTIDGSASLCGADSEECDPLVTVVEGIDDAVTIETGASVACVIDGDGGVHCWGWDSRGQLGDGRTTEGITAVPVRVLGFGE
jgi:alpha-tubulin suppressor-like RCC1 family protein